MSKKFVLSLATGLVALAAVAQQPAARPAPKLSDRLKVPPVSTTIPAMGIHLTTNLGSMKIKRGSEAPNFGHLEMTFRGTVLVSGLKGTATPSNGAELEFTQDQYNKKVFHSKGIGKLVVHGQFEGIQFFGGDLTAYYKGDGLVQLYGEFDKNLDTGSYWYDQNPAEKKFWGTSGMTITPTPLINPNNTADIKIKDVPPTKG